MTAYDKFRPSPVGDTAPVYHAAAASDAINAGQGAILIIKAGGTGTTCTIATPGTLPNGDAYPDKAVVVASSDEHWIGPLGPEYVDANGQVQLSWSSTTTVTWAAVSLS